MKGKTMEKKALQQEAFDKAYTGVMAQGRQSSESVHCRYYMPATDTAPECRCAIGHLLDLEEAKRFALNYPAHPVFRLKAPDKGTLEKYGLDFLGALQEAHDSGGKDLRYFRSNMRDLAKVYDLSTEVMEASHG